MGCPPDPIDVSLWRGNDDSKALKEKAAILIPQAKKAAGFFLTLIENYPEKIASGIFQKAKALQKDAEMFDASSLGKTFGYEDFPTSYNNYPDMSVMYAHLNEAEKYVKTIEINLCITRDLLLKTVGLIGEKELPEDFYKIVKEEKRLHLEHRKEDKAIKLKTLEEEISTCKFVITTTHYTYTDEERKECAEKLNLLEPEYKRIAALTDESLLSDREIF